MSVIICLCFDQSIQGFHHLCTENKSPCIDVHTIRFIYSPYFTQNFYRFLLQTTLYISILAIQIDSVVLTSFYMFLKGNRCGTDVVVINLKRIKQQQNISG